MRSPHYVDDADDSENVIPYGTFKRWCETVETTRKYFPYANEICMGKGTPHADIMIIGEGPGKDEDAKGSCFVGVSGRLLDEALLKAGLACIDNGKIVYSGVYITNLLKLRNCQPHGTYMRDMPSRLNGIQVKMHLPILLEEIARVKPKLIITLGRSALHSIIRDVPLWQYQLNAVSGMMHMLNVKHMNEHGTKKYCILPLYHPSFVLRTYKKITGYYRGDHSALTVQQRLQIDRSEGSWMRAFQKARKLTTIREYQNKNGIPRLECDYPCFAPEEYFDEYKLPVQQKKRNITYAKDDVSVEERAAVAHNKVNLRQKEGAETVYVHPLLADYVEETNSYVFSGPTNKKIHGKEKYGHSAAIVIKDFYPFMWLDPNIPFETEEDAHTFLVWMEHVIRNKMIYKKFQRNKEVRELYAQRMDLKIFHKWKIDYKQTSYGYYGAQLRCMIKVWVTRPRWMGLIKKFFGSHHYRDWVKAMRFRGKETGYPLKYLSRDRKQKTPKTTTDGIELHKNSEFVHQEEKKKKKLLKKKRKQERQADKEKKKKTTEKKKTRRRAKIDDYHPPLSSILKEKDPESHHWSKEKILKENAKAVPEQALDGMVRTFGGAHVPEVLLKQSRALVSCGWWKLNNFKLLHGKDKETVHKCNFLVSVDDISTVLSSDDGVSQQDITKDDVRKRQILDDTPDTRMTSLDIEVVTPEKGFPQYNHDNDAIVSICTVTRDQGKQSGTMKLDSAVNFLYNPHLNKPGKKHTMRSNPIPLEKRTTTYEFGSELDMLEAFANWTRKIQANIVTGWNSNLFDLTYIYNRARYLADKLPNCPRKWRLRKLNLGLSTRKNKVSHMVNKVFSTRAYGERKIANHKCPHTASIDAMIVWTKFQSRQASYTLDYTMENNLKMDFNETGQEKKARKVKFNIRHVKKYVDLGGQYLSYLLYYCQIDALGPLLLMEKHGRVLDIIMQSRVQEIDANWVYSRGVGIKIVTKLRSYCHIEGRDKLIPDINDNNYHLPWRWEGYIKDLDEYSYSMRRLHMKMDSGKKNKAKHDAKSEERKHLKKLLKRAEDGETNFFEDNDDVAQSLAHALEEQDHINSGRAPPKVKIVDVDEAQQNILEAFGYEDNEKITTESLKKKRQLHRKHKANLKNLDATKKSEDNFSYPGAYVFPPYLGFWEALSACLDFHSLYPSCMLSNHLAYAAFILKKVMARFGIRRIDCIRVVLGDKTTNSGELEYDHELKQWVKVAYWVPWADSPVLDLVASLLSERSKVKKIMYGAWDDAKSCKNMKERILNSADVSTLKEKDWKTLEHFNRVTCGGNAVVIDESFMKDEQAKRSLLQSVIEHFEKHEKQMDSRVEESFKLLQDSMLKNAKKKYWTEVHRLQCIDNTYEVATNNEEIETNDNLKFKAFSHFLKRNKWLVENYDFKGKLNNGKQIGVKITVNSVYGMPGNKLGRMPMYELPFSVTAIGQHEIKRTQVMCETMFGDVKYTRKRNGRLKKVEQTQYCVNYGDTDSIMPKSPLWTLLIGSGIDQALYGKFIFDVMTFVFNLRQTGVQDLENEYQAWKDYQLQKKRYMKQKFKFKASPEGFWFVLKTYFDYMGIEIKRRDTLPLTRMILKFLCDSIVMAKDSKKAVIDALNKILEIVNQLCNNEIALSQLIMSQKISKMEYAPPVPAHVMLNKKMHERKKNGEFSGAVAVVGDRQQYVFKVNKTVSKKKAKPIDYFEDPLFFSQNGLQINAEYYWEKRMERVLERVAGLRIKNFSKLIVEQVRNTFRKINRQTKPGEGLHKHKSNPCGKCGNACEEIFCSDCVDTKYCLICSKTLRSENPINCCTLCKQTYEIDKCLTCGSSEMDDGHVQCSCCHKKSLEEYREKNLKHLNETFSKDLEKSSAEKKKFIDICHKCIKDTSAPIEDPMQCTNISCEVYYDRTAPIMKTEILEKMCKTVPMLDKYENWESNHLDQTYSYCLDRDEKLKKSAFNKMLTLQRKESPVQTSCKHCREDTDNLVKHLLTQCEDPHVKHKRLKRDEKVSSMLRKYLHRKDIELVWERDMKDTKHSIVNTSQPLVFGVRGGLLGGVYANSIKKKITLDQWKAIVKYLVLKNRDILNYT